MILIGLLMFLFLSFLLSLSLFPPLYHLFPPLSHSLSFLSFPPSFDISLLSSPSKIEPKALLVPSCVIHLPTSPPLSLSSHELFLGNVAPVTCYAFGIDLSNSSMTIFIISLYKTDVTNDYNMKTSLKRFR